MASSKDFMIIRPSARVAAASAVLVLDQLTKHWAVTSLGTPGRSLRLPGPVDLTLVFNHSNAFGIIPNVGDLSRWGLAGLGIVTPAILIGLCVRSSTAAISAFAYAFISAGALGNALDRLQWGAVIDLFDASKLWFPWVFNLADVSIDLGVMLVLLAAVTAPEPRSLSNGQP